MNYTLDPAGPVVSQRQADESAIAYAALLATPSGQRSLAADVADPAQRRVLNDAGQAAAAGAQQRRSLWLAYQAFGAAVRPLRQIVLLTCQVGQNQAFVDALGRDWRVQVVAYQRFLDFVEINARVRLCLHGDQPGTGSNTARAEIAPPEQGTVVSALTSR